MRIGIGLAITQPGSPASPAGGGEEPGAYTAGAVHFDGATYLSNAALVATDSDKFYMTFAFKASGIDFEHKGALLTTLDFEDTASHFALLDELTATGGSPGGVSVGLCDVEGQAGDNQYYVGSADTVVYDSAWHTCIVSVETNFSLGNKRAKLLIDGVSVGVEYPDYAAAFSQIWNGMRVVIGNDEVFARVLVADIAELRIHPGVSLLDESGNIPLATKELFFDSNNKPVDPAVATAELGAPCMLFSGDASTFGTNQGTGGAFTTTGTLTNASTSPSD